MKGTVSVKVSDSRVRYSFELIRNITVVRGNSGTGKTTLFDMISAYTRLKDRSGVQIVCEHPCVALLADADWQARLEKISGSLVFIDEIPKDPGSSIDSQNHFSWENFFEDYLIQNTKDRYFAYSKSKLHSFYTIRENSEKIIALIAMNMPKPNHEP